MYIMMESHAQENMPLSVGFALNISQEEPHFISLNIVKSKIDVPHQIYVVHTLSSLVQWQVSIVLKLYAVYLSE